MNKFIGALITIFVVQLSYAQVLKSNRAEMNNVSNDSIRPNIKSKSKTKETIAKIEQYKIVNFERDTIYLDTTLSITKEYKFNYLRRDNFGLIPFSNIGQTYNSLSKDFSQNNVLPLFGARAKHFNYLEVDDINYYNVPTPLTELFFKTAFEQGQLLDAFFTVNTSPQFNFSIAYKGLRSLGNYQHIVTSTGNLRFTANYKTKNGRYNARTHIVTQDLFNEENGGLKDEDVINFENGIDVFIDRGVFDPNFENASNILKGKRFVLDHEFALVKENDSISNTLTIGQSINFEDKYYQFDQTQQSDFFGDAFVSSILDKTTLENFYNRFYFNYENRTLGEFQVNMDYNNYNYGYDNVTVLNEAVLPNRIKGNTLALGVKYKKKFGGLYLSGEALTNISGEFNGNFIIANAKYKFSDDFNIDASLALNSSAPNYNYLLYMSDYINYNWNNVDSFKNVTSKKFKFELKSTKIANLAFEYTNIDNYTFFGKINDSDVIKPIQSHVQINYFKVQFNKEIKYGKFALDNTIMYQRVIDGEQIMNVPEFITRNTLYYSNNFFKKALFLQTGVTLNYFTEYNMDAYDPLLAEFYVQNDTKIGGFPRLDFFINAKIRQTRIFFKAEHFNSAFSGYNYFSAPNYPYRDFAIRFGLVWNFFL